MYVIFKSGVSFPAHLTMPARASTEQSAEHSSNANVLAYNTISMWFFCVVFQWPLDPGQGCGGSGTHPRNT